MVFCTITDSDGNLNVFDVERDEDGESWLNSNYGNPSNFWNADNHFVFVSRRFLRSPLFIRRVLFLQSSQPSSEHLSYFIKMSGNQDIFFVV